jgi:hypothetical protein
MSHLKKSELAKMMTKASRKFTTHPHRAFGMGRHYRLDYLYLDCFTDGAHGPLSSGESLGIDFPVHNSWRTFCSTQGKKPGKS